MDGDLSFSAGATVRLPASVTADSLADYKDAGLPLFTATGEVIGCPALDAPGLGGAWRIRKRNGAVSLVMPKGMVIVFE